MRKILIISTAAMGLLAFPAASMADDRGAAGGAAGGAAAGAVGGAIIGGPVGAAAGAVIGGAGGAAAGSTADRPDEVIIERRSSTDVQRECVEEPDGSQTCVEQER